MAGFISGGFIGYLLGQVIPFKFFLIVSILLLYMLFVFFVLFYIGSRDLQEY
jgi:hypothetical protein